MNILITNVFGVKNKGDYFLLKKLISILQKSFPEVNLNIVIRYKDGIEDFKNTNYLKQIGHIRSENKFIKSLLYPYIHIIALLYLYIPSIFKYFIDKERGKTLNAYRDSDLIISSPGGFLEDSNKSYFINLYQLFLGIAINKPIIIAPQSIGPIHSKLGQSFVKFVLARTKQIFVREAFSYDFLINTLKVDKNKIKNSCDLAFYSKPISNNIKNSNVHYSTVVNWNFPNTPNPTELRTNYINTMRNYYRYIKDNYNKDTIILNQVSDDLPIAYEIQKNYESFISIDETNYEPEDLIDKISRTSFFTGTRFHSCIFSMIGGTNFIAVSYLPKTFGILKSMDLIDYQISINDVNLDFLIQKFTEINKNNDFHSNNIKHSVDKMVGQTSFEEYLKSRQNK